MSDAIVLSRHEADRMLRTDRRRIVTSEFEVATAKLIFDARAEEFEAVRGARLAFEAAFPWLLDETQEVPSDLRACEPGIEPEYRSIAHRYQTLCARGDKISDQMFSAPASLAAAMIKQADFETKNGQMVSAASAMAMILEVVAEAGQQITTSTGKDRFMVAVTRIRKDFINANPHLNVRSTGG